METAPTCPKCSGAMEQGYIPDEGKGNFLANWYPGTPEALRFLGMNTGIAKTNEKRRRPVVTYRCTQCGYLDSYAP